MAIHGLSHYNLRVPPALLDALRDFYCDVVGLSAGPRPPFDSVGHWLYAGGRPVLHLSQTRAGAVAPSPPQAGAPASFDHAAFDCSDRAEVERHLQQRGVPYAVAHVPLTGQVQLFLRDPAGHGVELNFDDEDMARR